jgi:hypothetical protein
MATLIVLRVRAVHELHPKSWARARLMQAFEQGARAKHCGMQQDPIRPRGRLPWIADPCLCRAISAVCCCSVVDHGVWIVNR